MLKGISIRYLDYFDMTFRTMLPQGSPPFYGVGSIMLMDVSARYLYRSLR